MGLPKSVVTTNKVKPSGRASRSNVLSAVNIPVDVRLNDEFEGSSSKIWSNEKLNRPPSPGSGSIVKSDRLAKSTPGFMFSGMVGRFGKTVTIIGDSSFVLSKNIVMLVLAVSGSGKPPSYASTSKKMELSSPL